MNLAIRGIDGNLGPEHGDSFHRDFHPDLKADYVLANPPFNDSNWGGDRLRDDRRWRYGVPPVSNANFAWVQHFIYHLAPTGMAGFVLANGSMSSNQSGEGEIRKSIIEADLVDCMIALPGQLFYSTPIAVCLWFLARDKRNLPAPSTARQAGGHFRDRRGETLFIDAQKLGAMVERTRRELTNDDVRRIADTYHAWRGDGHSSAEYLDVAGFCKAATLEDVRQQGYALAPSRYVGTAEVEGDTEEFQVKLARLSAQLANQMDEARRLDSSILGILEQLGCGKCVKR